MGTTDRKLAEWVAFTGDLLGMLGADFPVARIREQFWATFEAEPSWNCARADGTMSFEPMHSVKGWPSRDWHTRWCLERMSHHPLQLWYTATGNPNPQSRERVPSTVAAPSDHEMVREEMQPLGFEQQLAIPYHLSAGELRMFMLARSGRDFSDDDIDLARRVQPLIWLVDRQVTVLAGSTTPAAAADLTGRELAVLGLLSQGCTAEAIGRRLVCSPRTVHKHLEHLYRKLEVRDRLLAVQRGRDLGLLTAPQRRSA